MHLRIRIEKGPNKDDAFEVTDKSQPIIIGRGDSADFVIPGTLVSKEHCRVYADDDTKLIWIKDLGSTNGTYLNGERIDEVAVKPGDKVQIGEVLLNVEDAAAVKYTSDLAGKILGGYRIDERIGKGSMGTVYRANQLSLGREVALKVLDYNLSKDINFVKSFLNEARSAGKLNHPNVVQVHDVGEADGYYYFSMEFVGNGSVKTLLEDKGRLNAEEGLGILLGISRALEYAEQHKIIHCDIKPDNIMISGTGEAKLADLGIARKIQGTKADQKGKVFGSPDYIAPEQAQGKSIDHKVDIYALGITGYEVFSGRVPFTGKSTNEIIKKHVYEKPQPLTELVSNLPVKIWDVISKMIAKTPGERYASATELVSALDECLQAQRGGAQPSTQSRPAPPKKRVVRRRRRRRR